MAVKDWKTEDRAWVGLMELKDLGLGWRELSEEVITGMKEWRLQNPKATFAGIEKELDLRPGPFHSPSPVGRGLRLGTTLPAMVVAAASQFTGERPHP